MAGKAKTERPVSDLGTLDRSSGGSVGLTQPRTKSEPPETTYRALSLGTGVQSSVLALRLSRQDSTYGLYQSIMATRYKNPRAMGM
jgi:hypothetical protein